MTLPRAIDAHLVPRVGVAIAAKYLGRSPRWVQLEIAAGRLPAIDTSCPGAKRACWAIAVHDLRALVVRCEIQAERRLAEAKKAHANEPEKGE